MDKQAITERVKGILVEDLFLADAPGDISDTAELGTDLGLDSVGFVELATIVGEIFEIPVKDTDVGEGHFTNVQAVTDFVHGRLREKANAVAAE